MGLINATLIIDDGSRHLTRAITQLAPHDRNYCSIFNNTNFIVCFVITQQIAYECLLLIISCGSKKRISPVVQLICYSCINMFFSLFHLLYLFRLRATQPIIIIIIIIIIIDMSTMHISVIRMCACKGLFPLPEFTARVHGPS